MGLFRILRWLFVSRLFRRAVRLLFRVMRLIGWRRVAHAALRPARLSGPRKLRV
jgi:hypothetical protein